MWSLVLCSNFRDSSLALMATERATNSDVVIEANWLNENTATNSRSTDVARVLTPARSRPEHLRVLGRAPLAMSKR